MKAIDLKSLTGRVLLLIIIIALALTGCKKKTVQQGTSQADSAETRVAGDKAATSDVTDQTAKLGSDDTATAGAKEPVKDLSREASKEAAGSADPAQSQTPMTGPGGGEEYQTAKKDFVYGPGHPLPRLVLPPFAPPGPLASAYAPPAEGHTPGSPCATELAAADLDIGPKENWVSKKARQAVFGAFSRLLGGGGGGDDSGDDRPPTVKDPIPKSARQQFHDELSDTDLSISGRVTDDGLLLSTGIDDAPDKSTFHMIYVEDPQCRRYFPDRFLNYRLWLEWSLSVSWTRTRTQYQDGKQVSQQRSSGGYFKTGTVDLDKGRLSMAQLKGISEYQQKLLEDLPAPIWQQMGFSTPESGVRRLGSQFDGVTPAQLANGDNIAVVHVTRVVDGRYVTRGIPFRVQPGSDGLLQFSRL